MSADLLHAWSETGFCYVVGPNVPWREGQRLLRMTRELFFDPTVRGRPDLWADPHDPMRRGLSTGESVAAAAGDRVPPDLNVMYRVTLQPSPEFPNRWPSPQFETACLDYMQRLSSVGELLLDLVAEGLGIPHFPRSPDDRDSVFALNLYDRVPHSPLPGQSRKGSHRDFGTIAGLLAPAGLELLHPTTQTWHPITPMADALIFNVGLMLSTITGLPSAFHRVRAKPGEDERVSAVLSKNSTAICW